MDELRRNKVFKSLHKPLTFMGIERKLFATSLALSMGIFEFTGSLLTTLVIFAGSTGFAYWATQKDPAYLTIVLKADRFKRRYDAAKQEIPNVEIR